MDVIAEKGNFKTDETLLSHIQTAASISTQLELSVKVLLILLKQDGEPESARDSGYNVLADKTKLGVFGSDLTGGGRFLKLQPAKA
jgi:hypothetical protein